MDFGSECSDDRRARVLLRFHGLIVLLLLGLDSCGLLGVSGIEESLQPAQFGQAFFSVGSVFDSGKFSQARQFATRRTWLCSRTVRRRTIG